MANENNKSKLKKKKKAQRERRELLIRIALAVIAPMTTLAIYLHTNYRVSNPIIEYETGFRWLNTDEADSIYSSKSQIAVYDYQEGTYYSEAVLSVLFNNLSEYDRTITSFTVYAEDIVEDYSPNLGYIPVDTYDNLSISIDIVNDGWGESGPLKISVSSLELHRPDNPSIPVRMSLQKHAVCEWEFESLLPGETRRFDLLNEDDFIVTYDMPIEKTIDYDLVLSIEAVEHGIIESQVVTISITPDREIYVNGVGGRGPELTYYVVEIDTSKAEWSKTYKTSQLLPAKETVYFPIHIVPTMSCNMSVRIEFELNDGEILYSDPINNSHFIIPYHDDFIEYVNGELLNWNDKQEIRVVCFPFVSSSTTLSPDEIHNLFQ